MNYMHRIKKYFSGVKTSFEPKKRNVVFYRHSYYHFYYLAKALRKRGWDAITVSLEDPNGPNKNYYHGEDLNLYHADPAIQKQIIQHFYQENFNRFDLVHFAGDHILTFYEGSFLEENPKEMALWHASGKKVAHTISGCSSGTAQSSVTEWSLLNSAYSVCSRCVHQDSPNVCSNERNLSWGKKIDKYCDLICAETIPALDYVSSSNKVIREPLTMCLDENFWHPNLIIPDSFKLDKPADKILIYHAVGNYESRNKEGRNIKGTPAVFAAIEKLKHEGFQVELFFATDIKNTEVRFFQAQADIIVDQLNYGRYGANAREGMMLGKPVICYINPKEKDPKDELECLKELPLISATEETLYEVLKSLILDPVRLAEIGRASREYALEWHSADACAARYESVYDSLLFNSSRSYGK